jgi:protein-tyrosine phosphatase
MRTVLFLCSGNFYRSRFAETYFNAEAVRRGLAWQAVSRGFRLHPGNVGPISPHALAGLAGLGLAPPQPLRFPLVASADDLAAAAHIVAVKQDEHLPLMQRHFPDWVEQVEYWQIHDIDFAPPTAALPELRAHVDALLDRFLAASADSHA